MSVATLGLLGTVLLVLGTLAGVLVRMASRSPEQRSADAAVWTSLSGVNTGLAAEVGRLTTRLANVEAENVSHREQMHELRRKAEAGERAEQEVTWLRGLVTRLVAPIVAWIDAGAPPPRPSIPEELRTLLGEAEEHRVEQVRADARRADVAEA